MNEDDFSKKKNTKRATFHTRVQFANEGKDG